ncbi:hypothetical protein [Novosphingobium sp.]|uniref:hypothetical protein n=1 Tax=Novosphingobium sp. TaxID=1874826 RepID=UPI0032B87FFC
MNGAFRTNGLQPVSVRIYLKSAAELNYLANMPDGKLMAMAIDRTGKSACHQGWSKAIEALGGARISCEDNQSKQQQKSLQQAHARSLQHHSMSAILPCPECPFQARDCAKMKV